MINDASPRYEPIDRQQVVLEPLDVEQLIPEDHAARSVWAILGKLDLSRFSGPVKSVEGHAGRNLWEPRLLIAIWIYAYSRGISSAREIERQCAYEPALRWLTGLKVVNHHTLSDFRVEHGEALQSLFVQVLAILQMEKLITLERVMVDGTKVRAAVNKKTFSRAHKIREHLKVARVRNIADFLVDARGAGCWCYGASAEAEVAYDAPDYGGGGVVLVLGSEGHGLRPRVASACDQLIALPVLGAVESLGVSAAAAAVLYEILQNRRRVS